MATQTKGVTDLLARWRHGDSGALNRLMPLIYWELRRLAGHYLRHERPDNTLDVTDLVHEVYLRLVGKTHPRWKDRVHFYAVTSQLMRRILIDHARRVRALRRGGGKAGRVPLEDAPEPFHQRAEQLVCLDEALQDLSKMDARKAEIVTLRFFGGLTIEETARYLAISTATVINDTRVARAWLLAQMKSNA